MEPPRRRGAHRAASLGIARYDAATQTMELELTAGSALHPSSARRVRFNHGRCRAHPLSASRFGGGFGMKTSSSIPNGAAAVRAQARAAGAMDGRRTDEFGTGRTGPDMRRGQARARLDGRMLALDVAMVANLGAYLSVHRPGARRSLRRRRRAGVLHMPASRRRGRGAFTNTGPGRRRSRRQQPEATTSSSAPRGRGAPRIRRDPPSHAAKPDRLVVRSKTARGRRSMRALLANLDAAVARRRVLRVFAARRAESQQRVRLRVIVAAFPETCGRAQRGGGSALFESDGTVTVAVWHGGQRSPRDCPPISPPPAGRAMRRSANVQADLASVKSGCRSRQRRAPAMGGARS